jgi:hypothetical protein
MEANVYCEQGFLPLSLKDFIFIRCEKSVEMIPQTSLYQSTNSSTRRDTMPLGKTNDT